MTTEPTTPPGPRGLEAAGPIHGLVWAFAFDEAGQPEMLPDEEVPERLAARGGWVWLHFNLTDARARGWIAQLPLEPKARDIILSSAPRLKVSVHHGQIAGAVSDFSLEVDGSRSSEVGRLRFAMTEHLIVSVRHHPLRTIERVREELAGGRRLADVSHVFELIVDAFLDAAFEDIDSTSDEIDELEERVIGSRGGRDLGTVTDIRRGLLGLRREIVHLRAALRPLETSSLHAVPVARLHKEVASSAPRLIARLDALDHDIHNLQDRLRLVREEIDTLAAAETNRQLYVLSFLSAVFLPGTFVTSMFGMNTKDLPLGQTDDGFWHAMVLVGAATALVIGFLMMRRSIADRREAASSSGRSRARAQGR